MILSELALTAGGIGGAGFGYGGPSQMRMAGVPGGGRLSVLEPAAGSGGGEGGVSAGGGVVGGVAMSAYAGHRAGIGSGPVEVVEPNVLCAAGSDESSV